MNLYENCNSNDQLFKSFEEISESSIYECQHFIPIYNSIFSSLDKNKDRHLEGYYIIQDVLNQQSYNTYTCKLKDKHKNILQRDVVLKYSPIIDPIKYLLGKYDNEDNITLPNINNESSEDKINRVHNSAYVDGFFSYLTSCLNENNKFIHGIQFYGSFLAKKQNFKIDICDELDYLLDSKHFTNHINDTFTLENVDINDLVPNAKKKKIQIDDNDIPLELSNIDEMDKLNELFNTSNTETELNTNINAEEITITLDTISNEKSSSEHSKSNSSNSSCSSRSSNTLDDSEDDLDDELDDELDDNSDDDLDGNISDDDNSLESDEEVNAIIQEMPVNIICLEKCDNTLDYLLVNDELTIEGLESCLFQVIMILLTYQKLFSFTHNDLHTNNIMYINTDKPYIYYCYQKKFYRIPTFGKIFKIIDFGRAIYKYNNVTYCSDSFNKDGDAATQYNIPPFFNENKPRVEPNYSFDLTRLASAMFDFIVDDNFEQLESLKIIPVYEAIIDWCTDDKGRNILYKQNGDERYPDFKLYKMITRTVHNHTPENQLKRPCFAKYSIAKKKVTKKQILNIDSLIEQYLTTSP